MEIKVCQDSLVKKETAVSVDSLDLQHQDLQVKKVSQVPQELMVAQVDKVILVSRDPLASPDQLDPK